MATADKGESPPQLSAAERIKLARASSPSPMRPNSDARWPRTADSHTASPTVSTRRGSVEVALSEAIAAQVVQFQDEDTTAPPSRERVASIGTRERVASTASIGTRERVESAIRERGASTIMHNVPASREPVGSNGVTKSQNVDPNADVAVDPMAFTSLCARREDFGNPSELTILAVLKICKNHGGNASKALRAYSQGGGTVLCPHDRIQALTEHIAEGRATAAMRTI